eukprot:3056311-Pleurochrysis_carterae.AAC.1
MHSFAPVTPCSPTQSPCNRTPPVPCTVSPHLTLCSPTLPHRVPRCVHCLFPIRHDAEPVQGPGDYSFFRPPRTENASTEPPSTEGEIS